MSAYQPDEYWESLLGEKYDLSGVGHPEFPAEFNRVLYAQMLSSVSGLLDRHHVAVAGKRVLEVGAGTGFWVQLWDEQHAASVTGIDITRVAVDRLAAQYPSHKFQVADIGHTAATDLGTFDLVSAMSVLLHIVDQDRFRTAVANIATMLADGGHVVLMEPLVAHHWWGPPVDGSSNSRARTIAEWRGVLADNGLELVDTAPVTALLANVCDTRHRVTWRMHQAWWGGLRLLLTRAPALGTPVTRGAAVADRFLLARGVAPSAKVMLIRRTPAR